MIGFSGFRCHRLVKFPAMPLNELYLAVLPVIHLTPVGPFGFGLTEQVLTLLPGRDLATVFYKDEVDAYIATFQNRANKYLAGGHVSGYDLELIDTEDDRVVVKVVQRVG